MTKKKCLVVGGGVTGQSCIRFLAEQGEQVCCTDSRLDEHHEINARFNSLVEELDNVEVAEPLRVLNTPPSVYRRVVLSPGLANNHPFVRWSSTSKTNRCSDIDLFLDKVTVPVVAITGTNGKSTVTRLVESMLKGHGFVAVGNLGVPVLSNLNASVKGYVLEISSFQLERLAKTDRVFEVSAILNIAEDHTDFHGSFEVYRAAKLSILELSRICLVDSRTVGSVNSYDDRVIDLSADSSFRVCDDGVVIANQFIQSNEIALRGKHNCWNSMVAAAIAMQMGAHLEEVKETLKNFKGLPHRSEEVATVNDVMYINDSKATNAHATSTMLNSLRSSGKSVILMLGGQTKAQDLSQLKDAVAKAVKVAVLYGQDRELLHSELDSVVQTEVIEDFESAFAYANRVARAGDTVLLSPAAASFDQFNSFEDRGMKFAALVNAL